MNPVAAMNCAIIKQLQANGATYEEAYARLFLKQKKNAALPPDAQEPRYGETNRIRILSALKAKPGMCAAELSEATGIPVKSVSTAIHNANQSGLIRRDGPHNQPRYYAVTA